MDDGSLEGGGRDRRKAGKIRGGALWSGEEEVELGR
jgi:hypothetical protein